MAREKAERERAEKARIAREERKRKAEASGKKYVEEKRYQLPNPYVRNV